LLCQTFARTVARVRTRRAVLAAALAATLTVAGCGNPAAPAPDAAAQSVPPVVVPAAGAPGAVPAAILAAFAGKDLERLPTTEKVVALTFDAGANADAVPSILATLSRGHITATFFLTGVFVTKYPDAARAIAAAGHRIGNHSATHPPFAGLASALVRHEVLAGAASIQQVTGADPRPFFRFPFGSKDARALAEVNSLGYVAIRWTVDSLGWQGTVNGTRGPDFTATRVLAATTPGEIVLMHVGSNPTDHSMLDAAALPTVIDGLRQRGYGFTTLRTLIP
jgi:peptidoglycan-N-acetylglucosamine deacetylase